MCYTYPYQPSPSGVHERTVSPSSRGWSSGCRYLQETPLGWPGRSHGHYGDSVSDGKYLLYADTADVGAVAPPGQPAMSQFRHPDPALGHDHLSRDLSHADQQRHLQQPFISGQCDGHGAFSGTLQARGAVATKREPVTVDAPPQPHNCPLMNPPGGGELLRETVSLKNSLPL